MTTPSATQETAQAANLDPADLTADHLRLLTDGGLCEADRVVVEEIGKSIDAQRAAIDGIARIGADIKATPTTIPNAKIIADLRTGLAQAQTDFADSKTRLVKLRDVSAAIGIEIHTRFLTANAKQKS